MQLTPKQQQAAQLTILIQPAWTGVFLITLALGMLLLMVCRPVVVAILL
jgi:hypothetical protein